MINIIVVFEALLVAPLLVSISGPSNDVVTLPRDRVNLEAVARGPDGKKLNGFDLVWRWSADVGPEVKLKDIDKDKLTISELKPGEYIFTASVTASKHNRSVKVFIRVSREND